MSSPELPAGIYVHVPFCLKKCRYCDFYSVTQLDLMPEFIRAVLQEMELSGHGFPSADTLYFGGGTPSLLPANVLAELIAKAVDCFDLPPDAEMTLEINPATLAAADFKLLRAMGLNRLSIGIQSFRNEHLSFLGRLHSSRQAADCVNAARRSGFDNLGIDLIYGLPDQTRAIWQDDLRRGLELEPEHISCYILSYEPGTPLYQAARDATEKRLPESLIVDLFHLTHDMLSAAGYDHYEISNFAKRNHQSRHNRKYWNLNPYLGLGPAAHSYRLPTRWWNSRSLPLYLEAIDRQACSLSDRETLSTEQQLIELLYLGLRQSKGIDLNKLRQDLTSRAINRIMRFLARRQQEGYMVIEPSRCYLTPAGMLLLDHIAAELTALLD